MHLKYENQSPARVDYSGRCMGDMKALHPGTHPPFWVFHCSVCGETSEKPARKIFARKQTHCGCLGVGNSERKWKGQSIITHSRQWGSKDNLLRKSVRQLAVLRAAYSLNGFLDADAKRRLADQFGVTPRCIAMDYEEAMRVPK